MSAESMTIIGAVVAIIATVIAVTKSQTSRLCKEIAGLREKADSNLQKITSCKEEMVRINEALRWLKKETKN